MACPLNRASSIAFGLLLISGVAFAQATAQLNGRVTDESGACTSRRNCQRDANRYPVRPHRCHRRDRILDHAEHANRPVQA